MRILDRKVVRDLWHLRGPGVAIAIVVACGVASFVAMRSMVYHLKASQDAYYAAARFADVFANVKSAPQAVARSLAAIPGVGAVEVRTSNDVILDVPGLVEPATGHIVGISTTREPALDLVVVRRGRALAAGRSGEVVVSEAFASANALRPGDSLGAVVNGRWQQLHIVGVALSPEFVLEMRAGDLFPDNQHYGVVWMDEEAVAAAFGKPGAWTDAAVALAPGASESDVIARMDRLLARYGSIGAHGRSLQASHRYLSDEIEQNRTFAAILPAIFLAVGAFLINLVLSRLVAQQREQIGMLKAFGVGPRALTRHFTLLALGPVVPGAVAGCALGLWLAGKLAVLYQQFYRIPNVEFTPRPIVLGVAVSISVLAAVIGAVSALRRALRLPPAEAMRPETPARYRRGILERVGLDRLFPLTGRMALRAIERRPVRAGLSVLGMALAVAVVMAGNFGFDSVAYLRSVTFDAAMREDIAVTFNAPRDRGALRELSHLPGVLRAEPSRFAPVRLWHEQRSRQVALIGVADGAELRRVVDRHGVPVALPARGLMISSALATLLGVHVGDQVRVDFLTGDRPVHTLPVGALLDDLVGTYAYVSAGDLLTLLGAGESVDGAVLGVDRAARDSVYARLKRTPGVQAVSVRAAVLRNFDRTVAESFRITLVTLLIFASALAAGVVYNTARIALSERGRELASMRVLGFTRGEVATMLFGEQGMLAALALPAGFAIGVSFCWLMAVSLQSDLFRLPLAIRAGTYTLAACMLLAAGLGSAVLVRRQLYRLDLVAVLKTRE